MMIGLLVAVLAGPAVVIGTGQAGGVPPSSGGWMTDDEGVLELKLAHEEKARPDGGLLRIDSRRRLVQWEGIPGEVGCKLKVEAPFDEVKNVSVSDLAGFVLEFKKGKNRKLTLIPLPHAWWFVQQWSATGGSFTQTIPEGTLRDHDGASMTVTGAEGGAGARLKHREIPPLVVADTRAAANAIRAALGLKLLR